MKKTFLITGAGGYLGSEMVKHYLSRGYKIKALDRYFFGYRFEDVENENLEIIQDDTRWFDPKILKDVNVVMDLAGLSNDPSADLDPKVTREINYMGTVNVAQQAKQAGVEKYILSSSCSVYGQGENLRLTENSPLNPVSLYAECKAQAEKNILPLADNHFCVTFLRNPTLYGLSTGRMRFDLVVNLMTFHAWKNRKIFVLGGGEQWRPLAYLKDAITAFSLVAEEQDISKINKQVFNVGCDGQNYKIIQIANLIKNIMPNVEVELAPSDPDKRNYNVSFEKIKNVLGFSPQFTVKDAVQEIKDALDKRIVDGDDIRGNTVKFYKYLIDTDKILSKVKMKGVIF